MTIELWLATPDAASRFAASTLSPADAQRWNPVGQRTRRSEWQASRALQAHLAGRDAAVTSLSHAFGHAAMAVAPLRTSVGIDIEGLKPRAVEKLAAFAFSEPEYAQLLELPAEARLARFYLLWTLKESAAKALGIDLLVATRQCRFLREADGWHGKLPTARSWTAWTFAPRADLILSALLVGQRGARLPQPLVRLQEWPGVRQVAWRRLASIPGGVSADQP
jgi:4'-phosphopantetheinyl transferase